MKKITLEAVIGVIWFGVYLYDTTTDTPLFISMLFLTTHAVLTEIRKHNDSVDKKQ